MIPGDPNRPTAAERRPAVEYPPQLTPVQAWLLGYIDQATLRDRMAEMGDDFKHTAVEYGRAVTDEAYADTLIAEAQRALEAELDGVPGTKSAEHDVMPPEEQAYAMYEALTDLFDEAVRDREASVTGEVRPSDGELRAQFDEVCRDLGLHPTTGEQVADMEAER